MIELPYGIADFRRIPQEGLAYLDRTAHIRDVERWGSTLVFPLAGVRNGRSYSLNGMGIFQWATMRVQRYCCIV